MSKTDGFVTYKPEHLRKINAIRRAISAPDAKLPPILNNGQVNFSAASEADNEPRSCANCSLYNYGRSCKLMGEKIKVRKFTWPHEPLKDSKPIEYWPICGYWVPGEPNYGDESFVSEINPDNAGLIWVNAPKVGLSMSGSSCGGANNGDDCDLWMTKGDDKRAEKTGFCRVLQRDTNNLDCCSAWQDDDRVNWQTAQERIG